MLSALAVAAFFATIADDLRSVAALRGEPSTVAAAALTRDDAPILTIENSSAFDPASPKRRAVVFGATDSTAAAVLALVRWFKTDPAASTLRNEWELSAMPMASFDPADTKGVALTRWITFQAPDVVIEVVDEGRSPIGPGDVTVETRVIRLPAAKDVLGSSLRAVDSGGQPRVARSPHDVMKARVAREPLAIATMLARRYPEQPSISYIPALSWVNALKLGAMIGDAALAQRVREQTRPWTSGAQPLFGPRIQLTSVAGTMVFAELGGDALPLAFEGARLAAARKPDGIAEYGQGWTDDMFMASAILARVGKLPQREAALDAAAKLVLDYAARLQRSDGVFIHAADGPFAWGRGNGFAAFGLVETLTALPPNHPSRTALLDVYRRHMTAMKTHQSPDGMWREVIDEPGAYREETATAMLLTAMARGIRLGWVDGSFRAVVDHAWRALAAHVAEDGTLIDVCTGTGAGPTKKYYLDRAAIVGADDRGGAMALVAAMEMIDLRR